MSEPNHLRDLKPDAKNARKHNERNLDMITTSMQTNGFGRSILLAKDGTVLAGNATVEAAGQIGLEDVIVVPSDGSKVIAVMRTDLDPNDPRATSLAIADNRAAELAEWDTQQLEELVLDGLDLGQFWSEQEQEILMAGDKEARADRDDSPTDFGPSRVQRGDVWRLGPHMLMCGDCVDKEIIYGLKRIATDGIKLVVTSPPYGVKKNYDSAKNEDSLTVWRILMRSFASTWAPLSPLIAVNLGDLKCGPQSREVHTYGELCTFMEDAGARLVATRVWVKPPVWQSPYYASSYRGVDDYEYIGLFGEAPYIEQSRLPQTSDWRYRSTWDFPSVVSNDDHPSKFPVELPSRMIRMTTDPGDIVVDPFAGSGTTMIACHELDRRNISIELSPRYCDLILGRYEAFTGEAAQLVMSEEDFTP